MNNKQPPYIGNVAGGAELRAELNDAFAELHAQLSSLGMTMDELLATLRGIEDLSPMLRRERNRRIHE